MTDKPTLPTPAQPKNIDAVEAALVANDLSKLSQEGRMSYYKQLCESLGLNPLTQPFEYITLNGKLRLYAKRDAADQLRKINGVSIKILEREIRDGIYIVLVEAIDKTGRVDQATGALSIGGLKGESYANALMKCETKAKRRVTLSICGLGFLDETEVETIKGATIGAPPPIKTGSTIDVPPNGPVTETPTKEEEDAIFVGVTEKYLPLVSLCQTLDEVTALRQEIVKEVGLPTINRVPNLKTSLNSAFHEVMSRIAKESKEKEPTDGKDQ